MLNSPIESLVFNLSFQFFSIVNNLWTWVAVITAAVSFWKIRAAAGVTSGNRKTDPLRCNDLNAHGSSLVPAKEHSAVVSAWKSRAAGVKSGCGKSDPLFCNDGDTNGSSLVSAKESPDAVIRAAGVFCGCRESDPLPCNDGNSNGSSSVSAKELTAAVGVISDYRKPDPLPCNDRKENGSPVSTKELPAVHRELIPAAGVSSGSWKSDPFPSYNAISPNGSLSKSKISLPETVIELPAAQVRTKAKFMVQYENESENYSTGGAWECGGGYDGGEWWENWEKVLMMKMGYMGWYRNQKLPAVNGNVVRFWDERDNSKSLIW